MWRQTWQPDPPWGAAASSMTVNSGELCSRVAGWAAPDATSWAVAIMPDGGTCGKARMLGAPVLGSASGHWCLKRVCAPPSCATKGAGELGRSQRLHVHNTQVHPHCHSGPGLNSRMTQPPPLERGLPKQCQDLPRQCLQNPREVSLPPAQPPGFPGASQGTVISRGLRPPL